MTYKTYIEIAGHCGKEINTPSFPQFIWIPRFFDMELYTANHDLHHSSNNCNYSKRFSLWDKVFGTYSR
jgi:sterol desaturase/sphingolipid hydroxylase (fatty acid hydroxylase superfamily)